MNPLTKAKRYTSQQTRDHLGRDLYSWQVMRNIDFRNYQKIKQKGGNVLSFSDLKFIALPTPLEFSI